jgi:hypothetical protein
MTEADTKEGRRDKDTLQKKAQARPTVREYGVETLQESTCFMNLGHSPQSLKAQKEVSVSVIRQFYSSITPRLNPIVTAWVRSLAPSFESMFAT